MYTQVETAGDRGECDWTGGAGRGQGCPYLTSRNVATREPYDPGNVIQNMILV